MEEQIVPSRLDRLEQIYQEQLTQVFSAESVVPDTLPDVASILFSDAQVCIRSGSPSEGSAVLEGTIYGTVVYLPEGSGAPQRLNITLPLTMTARSDRIEDACRLVFSADPVGAEARALNTRKISFRVEVSATVRVCKPGSIDLTADIGDLVSLESLPGEADFGFIRDIGEKAFTVADDVDLSTPIEQILWYQTNLFAENTKKLGGRLILQGGVELQLMYLPPDSDEPCFERFRIPFSQLMDSIDEEATISVVELRTVSSFVEILPGLNKSESVSIELQLSAQILYVCEQKLSYISDAYSLRCPILTVCDTLDAAAPYSMTAEKASVSELIKLPEPVREIISVWVRMTPCVMSDEGVKTTACVCILYRTETALRSVTKKLPVTFDGKRAGTDCLYSKAVCYENYISMQGDVIELRLDVELSSMCAKKQQIKYVSKMESDASAVLTDIYYPSVVAVRVGERSIWELAKTYHSTVALIEASNAGSEESDSLLLIPRGR